MTFKKWWLLLAAVAIYSCTPKLESWFLTSGNIPVLPAAFEESGKSIGKGLCYEQENYQPDSNSLDHLPVKYVRVNFHWVNSSDSTANYYGKKAIDFSKGLIHACNYDLRKNRKMWLPYNNDTPVIPTQYRMVIAPDPDDPNDDGIYFHFDDELVYYVHKGKNRNLYEREVIKKYGIQLDTVLNIFIMPHHPDSVASPSYLAVGVGVALGNAIKIAGVTIKDKDSYWNFRGVLNHEVGHIYGLSHTWAFNDGCDDTPRHRQDCWNRGQSARCDTATSNNVMDYNAMEHAWTPCQVGKVQMRMATLNHRSRKFLEPNWCELHHDRHVFIDDKIEWNGARDLEGHLTVRPGGTLTIRCRVSLPKDAKITVQPGGTLILDGGRLHNACGDQWAGIEIQREGAKEGKVAFLNDPQLENAPNTVF